MRHSFGKDSELYIKAGAKDGITILEDVYFTAPYKIAKPFFDNDTGVLDLVLMSASAGIMQGDSYKIRVEMERHARASLHGQSYSKIHRMKTGHASQTNTFILKEGALFDYAPRPCIPFANSSYHSTTDCYLDSGSVFLYSEVLACGRDKSGERFQFNEYRNCIRVYQHQELLFLDHQRYNPAFHDLEGIGFFEGYSHQATMGFFSDQLPENMINDLYDILYDIDGIDFGVSKTHKRGVVVRILGHGGDRVEKILLQLRREFYSTLPGI